MTTIFLGGAAQAHQAGADGVGRDHHDVGGAPAALLVSPHLGQRLGADVGKGERQLDRRQAVDLVDAGIAAGAGDNRHPLQGSRKWQISRASPHRSSSANRRAPYASARSRKLGMARSAADDLDVLPVAGARRFALIRRQPFAAQHVQQPAPRVREQRPREPIDVHRRALAGGKAIKRGVERPVMRCRP